LGLLAALGGAVHPGDPYLPDAPCYRVPLAPIEDGGVAILIGDEVVEVPRRRPPTDVPWWFDPTISQWPQFSLKATAPCWQEVARQPCVKEADGHCLVRALPTPDQCTPVPFFDPLCAAFEAVWELEPIAERTIGPGNENLASGVVHHPNPVMGLYRLVQERRPIADQRPRDAGRWP
jgi:hypothetical protein